jgi:aspartate/glutamate racemase
MSTAPSTPRIALIHALQGSLPPIASAFAEDWPEAQTLNILDDSLSVDRAAEGYLSEQMKHRFQTLTDYAVDNGADAILFTCSAFHEAIGMAAAKHKLPVLTPDEAMMERAVASGKRIGMLATFEPTLETASHALRTIAAAHGREVDIHAEWVPGALEALQSGDAAGHEALIVEAARGLPDLDALMLAQFTMSVCAPAVRAAVSVPVLTSPHTSVAKLKRLLGEKEAACAAK